ncbi:MAG: dTDP-4-dehydrorhamnose reductase [Muribaculaceae bacterium]|nr:dTDP-4-dehydrorhamnose reductase [Muribaculaceae bacterium]MBQ7205638.1 dTDP-4-dehydrorhamnose reductase [Muribaculaceae bacterium]
MGTTNILITGANGQLGHEMRNVLEGDQRFHAIYTDVDGDDIVTLDILDEDSIEQMLVDNSIDVIVNCAAYTAVDAAEDNELNAALLNGIAVGLLARAAKRHNARMVHISTDYVFNGKGCLPYTEEMPTNPQSVYGRTKLDGENLLLDTLGDDAIILRTAWLYSPYGKNFVKTMLALGKDKPALKVVFDQVGSPTCARDLANAIVTVMSAEQWHGGIYHFSNEGVISWYDFTLAIHRLAGITTCDVQPCHSDEFPAKAHRPAYSVLDKTKFKTTFGVTVPYWLDSLATTLKQL